jgi:hypothetical protein
MQPPIAEHVISVCRDASGADISHGPLIKSPDREMQDADHLTELMGFSTCQAFEMLKSVIYFHPRNGLQSSLYSP